MTVRISRRCLLASVAAGLAVVHQSAAHAQDNSGQALIAEKTSSKLLDGGQVTEHWRLRADGKLPIVRAKQGEPFTLRLNNTLEEDIWIHLYGVRGEAAMTTALLPKGPDGTLELTLTPPDAGTFWIGPLLSASKQREMGLYAMLIVEEAQSPFEDIPLILDDWKISSDGKIEGGFGDVEAAASEGRIGNWYTVNGAAKPRMALAKDKPTRLRLLNVCNTRTLNVQLKGGDALIIAVDGQPLKPMPFPGGGLQLAPGQRADVVPTGGEDEFALTFDLFEDAVEVAFFTHAGNLPQLPDGFSLTANPWPLLDASASPRSVSIALQGGIKGGLQSATVDGQMLDLRSLLEKGLAWAINGAAGLQAAPLFEAKRGEPIILAIENQTIFNQPLAIAGHVWHQLAEDGRKVTGQFWRDTAVIPPKAKSSFVFVADNPGLWTLSGLVAERSDAGLIGAFKVVDGP